MVAATEHGKPCSGIIQSCCPKQLAPELEGIKGANYYEPTFVPPAEAVTEIDKRDQVQLKAAVFITLALLAIFRFATNLSLVKPAAAGHT
jgi:hypothetical protein